MRQITNWNVEWKIETSKHDGEENPPTRHGRDECEGTARLRTRTCQLTAPATLCAERSLQRRAAQLSWQPLRLQHSRPRVPDSNMRPRGSRRRR